MELLGDYKTPSYLEEDPRIEELCKRLEAVGAPSTSDLSEEGLEAWIRLAVARGA